MSFISSAASQAVRLLTILALAGCSATAVMIPTESDAPSGVVSFYQSGKDLKIHIQIVGLEPNSSHGLHVHELGDCRAPAASSMGAHFNPLKSKHGGRSGIDRHLGDLGNITADENGVVEARLSILDTRLSGPAERNILGRALVLTKNSDDEQTQPDGNSGLPIACGLISKNPAI
jgi:Cu-Zn family superoxide dismutase